jgi:uncharacterized protein YbaR (Trm112 family)
MIDQSLLEILACPETKQKVVLLDQGRIAKINQSISAGMLLNRSQKKVDQTIDSALVRQDGKFCYPIRNDIPVMLIDEAIELASF